MKHSIKAILFLLFVNFCLHSNQMTETVAMNILGISPDTQLTSELISKIFRNKVSKERLHPDKNGGNDEKTDLYKKMNEAKEVLLSTLDNPTNKKYENEDEDQYEYQQFEASYTADINYLKQQAYQATLKNLQKNHYPYFQIFYHKCNNIPEITINADKQVKLALQIEEIITIKSFLNPFYHRNKDKKSIKANIIYQNNMIKSRTPQDRDKAEKQYKKIIEQSKNKALIDATFRTAAVLTVGAALGTAYYLSKRK